MEVKEGMLFLGGLSADSLVREYGSPIFVYEGDRIVSRFQELRKYFPIEQVDIHYAMKANYNPSLLKLLRDEDAWIDAVSPGDVRMALTVGFVPEKVLFTGSNSRFEEIEYCANSKVPINLGSLELLARYGETYPDTAVSIRINPGMGAGHHVHCITGGPDSKFGIYVDQLDEARSLASVHGLNLIGIHSHIGTGIREADAMLEAMELVLDAVSEFPDLVFIDFGGGFDIPYREGDPELNLVELSRKMMSRFDAFCANYGRSLRMKIEPGRFIVGPSGTLLTRVTNISSTPTRKFVGVDSGFNHFIRPTLYGAFHRIINASSMDGDEEEVVVVGNICESGDIFSREGERITRVINALRTGDCVAILDAGAYGMSMASQYNLRELPAEILATRGNARIIRRAQKFADMVREFPDMEDL